LTALFKIIVGTCIIVEGHDPADNYVLAKILDV